MSKRIILALLIWGGILPATWGNTFTMYKSVTLYVVQPDREGPAALTRDAVLTQWDKKIELGLAPTYRFSRLFGLLQGASGKRDIDESSVGPPQIVVIAKKEDGTEMELDLSLHSGIMVLRGGLLKDGELYREIVRFVVEMAGEKLPGRRSK